jgi:hypothetical protein
MHWGELPTLAVRAMRASLPPNTTCRCVAFTYEIATGCGFLKSGSSTSSRSGWVAYTR